MRPCLGLDNGVSGAIAWVCDHYAGVIPFKTWEDGKDTCIDEQWLHDTIAQFDDPFIVVEKAQKFSPGKLALCSTWNAWATIRTVLRLGKFEYIAIPPQQWQRVMLKGYPRRTPDDTKGASVLAAKVLFPGVSLLRTPRCRTDDDGMSDALCLAEFGRRSLLAGS